MELENNTKLTSEQITNLKKNGHDVDEDGYFYGMFLFNDKLNEATDPVPFQIHSEALHKIAKTFIGRPHVVRPEDIEDEEARKLFGDKIKENVGEHVRGEIDDPKKIIEFQKDYSIGEMKTYYISPFTNNVYGIYKAFPEYAHLIEEKKIPKGTSPLLEPRKMIGQIIHDAIGLHVQSVGATGYDPKIAKITGTCQGMLNACTSMLATMGASKSLVNFRRNLLNSTNQQGVSLMPEKTIQELEAELKNLNTKLEDANTKIQTLGANGSKQTLEIPKEITDKLSKFDVIEKENTENKTLLAAIKKEREDEKAKIAQSKREELALIIANGEIITKEYPEDKLDERKKFWTELKGEDGSLKDISLLAEKFQKMIPKTVGSSGLRAEDLFPQMGSPSTVSSTFDIMEEIGN